MNDKMIEEMARVIDDRLVEANNYLGSMNKGTGYWIAQKLVEHYQPKAPEGSVVLSKEEFDDLQNKLERYSEEREFVGKCLTDATLRCVELTNDFNDMLDSIYDLARKKTAKEIFEKVVDLNVICGDDFRLFLDSFELWVKEHYGVEVEE